MPKHTFIKIGLRLIMRLLVLNLMTIIICLIASWGQSLIWDMRMEFPFALYLLNVFFVNLVYVVGCGLELLSLLLKKRTIHHIKFEHKYFRFSQILLISISTIISLLFIFRNW